MVTRTRCAGIILFKEESVLLVKHMGSARFVKGTYGFPAGRLEPGETSKQAAVRELYEETGLKVVEDSLQELCVKHSTLPMKNGPENFEYHIFVCTQYSGILEASEKTIPEFISISTISFLENKIGDTEELTLAAWDLLHPTNDS